MVCNAHQCLSRRYLSEEVSIYMVKNIKYDISMVALKVCNKGGILNETCVSMIQV